jgi:hypothetical protein
MSPQKQPNLFFKYSNIALQMAVIIGLSVWGGQKLDLHYKTTTPWYTLTLSLAGIFISLYLVLKDLINPKK